MDMVLICWAIFGGEPPLWRGRSGLPGLCCCGAFGGKWRPVFLLLSIFIFSFLFVIIIHWSTRAKTVL